MLSKFDDYTIHQTSPPIAQPATETATPTTGTGSTATRTTASLFRRRRRAVPEPRHPRLGPEHRARRRAARVPRVTARAAGADRPADRTVRDRRARTDAPHPRDHRRERHRHRRRPHVHRAHRVHRGGAPDPFARPPPRHGRHPLRQFGKWRARSATTARRSPSTRRALAPRTAAGACEASASPTPASPHPPARPRRSSSGAAALGRPVRTTACSRTPTGTAGTPTVRCCRSTRRPRTARARRTPLPSCSPTSSTTSTTSPGRAAPGTLASRSSTPTAGARTSTSSRSSASA